MTRAAATQERKSRDDINPPPLSAWIFRFRLKQASESGAAELQNSLEEERERSAGLQQDLATARHDVGPRPR